MHKPNDQPDLLKKRHEFILDLLKKKPEPNFCNFETGWRPINWLAAHGDKDLLNKLLESNAVSFLSDYKSGYFPVDIAGLNGHGATVAILINDYLKHIKMLL
jgi:ankyrin repeat protein